MHSKTMLKRHGSKKTPIYSRASDVVSRQLRPCFRAFLTVVSATALAVFAAGLGGMPERLRAEEFAQPRFDYTGAYRFMPQAAPLPRGVKDDHGEGASAAQASVRSASPLGVEQPSVSRAASHHRITYEDAKETAPSLPSDKVNSAAPIHSYRPSTANATWPNRQGLDGTMPETENVHDKEQVMPPNNLSRVAGNLKPGTVEGGGNKTIVPELTGQFSSKNEKSGAQPDNRLSAPSAVTGVDGVSRAEPGASQFTERSAAEAPPQSDRPALSAQRQQSSPARAAQQAVTSNPTPLPAVHPLRDVRQDEQSSEERNAGNEKLQAVRRKNTSPGKSVASTPTSDGSVRSGWAQSVFQLD